MENFYFDESGRFVLEDFAQLNPFASFLPGVAGPLGIPMWVFYVNRGQAIAAFGIESKDSPIMEFQPANKAYQTVPYTGFRTFIKLSRQGDRSASYYEPFAPLAPGGPRTRRMHIGMNELELREDAPDHNLRVNVLYFNLTGEPFAGLVRRLTVTNTGRAPVTLSVLDGLPAIMPYGVTNTILKEIGRTAEAWMGVFNVEENIPFYRLRSSIADKVEIEGYEAGHFYLCFSENGDMIERLPALVDPALVFGANTALSFPDRLLERSLPELYRQQQIKQSKTPCGFFGAEQTLPPGETWTMNAIIGHAGHVDTVNQAADRLCSAAYIRAQHRAARDLVRALTGPAAITTGLPLLDAYTAQTFLDNVLRGGWPVLLSGYVQHIYSRKHGDLERDYNAFYVAPECYSQGNGNYRDVNQNRREDVWFNPQIEDFNVITFMNLIQADGYNPLVIEGSRFVVPPEKRAAALEPVDDPAPLALVLAHSFTPGALLKHVSAHDLKLSMARDAFVAHVLHHAEQRFEATFGEGYWVDHWTYNLDLIENYLAIYPERQDNLLFGKPVFTFYDSPVVVRPRHEKTVLVGGRVRQINAVAKDVEKQALIAARTDYPHTVRTRQGQGEIVRTTLFVKLVCLALTKFATLDPLGMGVEMEAGRPGWYDALNGLPGLFGSSMPETYTLARLLIFMREAIQDRLAQKLDLPVEIAELWQVVMTALENYQTSDQPDRDWVYWDAVASARETYRARVRLGFDGETVSSTLAELDRGLGVFLDKVRAGITRAETLSGGMPPTYFRYDVDEYAVVGQTPEGQPTVRATHVSPHVLPPFLEGPVRALKLAPDIESARRIYQQVKDSALFDRTLRMYKVNAPLDGEPMDIGRARAFTPGWLENESIWLHMAYKYLLALLDAGLYAEFYEDFRHVLIPFQDPAVYGRSPLENSSFIVSSAHPDVSLHGRGFVARLSGSTAEYLSILHRIMIGARPFSVQEGALTLTFTPVLPGWLFDEEGIVTFTFLGHCTVTLHNPARRDTFGPDAAAPQRYTVALTDGEHFELTGNTIGAPVAALVREGRAESIHIYLA